MQAQQEALMRDTCVVSTLSLYGDAHGQMLKSYTDTDPVPCGLIPSGGRKVHEATSQSDGVTLTTTDAALRVPLGTTVAQGDRVTITHRAEEALDSPQVYYVTFVHRGHTILLCSLRAVSP